jgi:two-component system chemotaxis response regulator CheY
MIKRILIVDDSPIVHKMLRKILEKNGYEVCADAMNGIEAVEMHQSCCPDLTFMDITMPGMDGMEASKIIKEKNSDAKMIMVSSIHDDQTMARVKQLGIDVFLHKPFHEFMIISAIAKII